MKIKRQLNQDEQKDLIKDLVQNNNSDLHSICRDSLSSKDTLKDSDALVDDNSNKEQYKKENLYENLAGPSLIYKALEHVRRLNGTERISKPLKAIYLPDDIKSRLKDLEDTFEQEGLLENSKLQDEKVISENHNVLSPSNTESNTDLNSDRYKSLKGVQFGRNADDSLFYKKAMQHVNRMNNEKKAVLAKISKNLKLFLIIIIAFAGYYAYNEYTRSDEELSVSAIQAKLPLKLDLYTTLQKVSLDDNSLALEVVKAKESFQDIKDLESALNVYIQSASSNFCKIPLFSDMIKKGRRISVLLKADDNSFNKEFVVSHCDK